MPELFLDTFDYNTDPTWHEFESIEHTNELASSSIEIEEFLETLKTFSP